MKCTCENCSLSKAFFQTLDEESVIEYCTSKQELTFPPKTQIIKQGDPVDKFIYLRTGLVKLERYNEKTGINQIISFNRPKDFISLMDVFGQTAYSYSISTLEESTFCLFDLKEIKKLINTNGEFGSHIIDIIGKGTNRIINDLLMVIEKRFYGKVAHLLLYFGEEIYQSCEFDLPISRKEMSEHLGLSTETIIRTLSEFRKDGLIKVYGKRIEIVDKEGLWTVFHNN